MNGAGILSSYQFILSEELIVVNPTIISVTSRPWWATWWRRPTSSTRRRWWDHRGVHWMCFLNWNVLKVHKTLGAGAVAATEWFSRYTSPCWIQKENMLSPISSLRLLRHRPWPWAESVWTNICGQDRVKIHKRGSCFCVVLWKSIAEINSVLIRNIRSWRGCGCQSKTGNYQIMHRSVLLSSTYVLNSRHGLKQSFDVQVIWSSGRSRLLQTAGSCKRILMNNYF